MTSKDKAEELLIEYGKIIAVDRKFKADENGAEETITFDKEIAKKCALHCVDKLIVEQKQYSNCEYCSSTDWEQVKTEIEKL